MTPRWRLNFYGNYWRSSSKPVDLYEGFDVFEVGVSGDDGSALLEGGNHGKGVRIGNWKPGFQPCRFKDEVEIVCNEKDRKLKEMILESAPFKV